MQKPCQNFIGVIRIVKQGKFGLVCWRCGKKEFEHTTERVQATRSLSFTLRSLVKLMKVSIAWNKTNVKY